MKSLTTFLAATLLAFWIGAIAILSVQNFSPVQLRFLNLQLFEIPIGLVLAFSVGLGAIGTAVLQPLLKLSRGSDIGEED
jgi:uncharacterized integral membrane protein